MSECVCGHEPDSHLGGLGLCQEGDCRCNMYRRPQAPQVGGDSPSEPTSLPDVAGELGAARGQRRIRMRLRLVRWGLALEIQWPKETDP